jgi:excisionase family DNA binding protein
MNPERLAYTRVEAARSLGMGLTTFEERVQPDLRVIRVGRKVLVPARELEHWIAANVEAPMASLTERKR